MAAAQTIIGIVELYGLAGMAVAAAFLLFGIDRVDDGARGAYMFRPLIAPGVVVLWPLVLARWLTLELRGPAAFPRQRPLRAPHARIWLVLGVLLPALLLAALVMRQTRPADRPAVQITESGTPR